MKSIALLVLFVLAVQVQAGVIRVKADAVGTSTGLAWPDAYTDLQAALAAARWGDEIWVAAGTYKPTAGTDRNISFVMTAGVAIYGGFAGSEGTRGGRDWKANETILSGDIGAQGDNSDNSSHVIDGGFQTVLDGFTVEYGRNATIGDSVAGMMNYSVSPVVANCTFRNIRGIAMENYCASPTITNCVFVDNSSPGAGGAVYNYSGSSPVVTNCTFQNNSANGAGGGMFNSVSSAKIMNCLFIGNTASAGGGMLNSSSVVSVINCVFIGNRAIHSSGGGMLNQGFSPNIINCTFTGNTAVTGGGGMANVVSRTNIVNCVFWGNTSVRDEPEIYDPYSPTHRSVFRYCDIAGCGGSGPKWKTSMGIDGGGNIDANPKFMNPAALDGLALQAGSPCVDAGTAIGAPGDDFIKNPRKQNPDLGAYEFDQLSALEAWTAYR